MAEDKSGVTGHVSIVLKDKDGNVKDTQEIDNLVTQVGDQYYGERAALSSGLPNQVSGMRLGTGSTAAAKTGAGAAIVTYISGSHRAIDGTYPQSSLSTGRVITWRSTWAAGTATNSAITEAVITNEASLTDVAGTAANTISRVVFSAINKGASDSLELTWTHTLLGA